MELGALSPAISGENGHVKESWEEAYRAFSWDASFAALGWSAAGPVNLAWTMADRHGDPGRIALHWLGKDGRARDVSFDELGEATGRFANLIHALGVRQGDRVDTLPLPRWLQVHDLEDLKNNLASVVIAVLAVLFLREAVAWDGSRDLLAFGAALALVVASLTFFLAKKGTPKD
jgi:hypothetical protein